MLNKVQLIGNLGRDAELRYTPSGKPVASMNLATKEVWKDASGQKKEKTEWHRLVLWGKVAESLQEYLVKGKQLYIEGRLQTRSYDKDGQKHYTTEIVVDQVRLLGGGNGNGRHRDPGDDDHDARGSYGGNGGNGSYGGGGDFQPMTDDDIPF